MKSLICSTLAIAGALLCAPVSSTAETGKASWYGPGLHGRKTASGERFDQRAMTAAHPFLPFGARVRVFVLPAGRSCVVRINDRGPFVRGRIIDLSAAAATACGFKHRGTARVRVVAQ